MTSSLTVTKFPIYGPDSLKMVRANFLLDEVSQLRFFNYKSKFTAHVQYAATPEVEITDWRENLNMASHTGVRICVIQEYQLKPQIQWVGNTSVMSRMDFPAWTHQSIYDRSR